jgi:hypothetical protein
MAVRDKMTRRPRTILQALADPRPTFMNRTYARTVP